MPRACDRRSVRLEFARPEWVRGHLLPLLRGILPSRLALTLHGEDAAGFPKESRAEAEAKVLGDARKLQDEMTAASIKRLPADQTELAPSARVRLAVDAMLDRLLATLTAAREP